ncbi:hypothetical protein N8E89_27975 (plasmid) [Phyllobacterium sp. A18/5-2]|uniref:hypothetical protein n=1 Tax=Phyllobacterium sp. A18/5-2 TaxID=2978392 RepID=UPI0021C63B20|nr:hypothetical protein [Phyllobacterium sp. A18/5-2]UXN67725.1 hypothetical protein N8E89_27975 [Phyllobacterium sp. A18/5-2]
MVTNDGTISRLAADSGENSAPSTPMATVGSPMPVTPFTKPAAKKVAVTATTRGIEESIISLA